MKKDPKNEVVKSTIAVVAALAMVGTTSGVYYWTQPVAPDQYAKVGSMFFETFDSSDQIAMMQLTALDADGKPQTFELEKKGGLWRIPTHYDYPAEAGQRLSQTATSLQGLTRLRLANSNKGAQDDLGVLDPNSEEAKENPESAGKLIVFKDSNDETLFDLIVGKKVDKDENVSVYNLREDEVQSNLYYVRVPEENDTYIAELNLDISTKFSDWINKDLLEVERRQLRKLELDNYRLESKNVITNAGISVQRQLVREGSLDLEKTTATGPWTLADLGPQEEVDSVKVDEVLSTIESMELVGVKPQYKYQGQSLLDDELELNLPESLKNDQRAAAEALDEMQNELLDAGFGLAQEPQTNKVRLVAEYGEMKATSDEGIIYTLLYGAEVKGEGSAIEIGEGEKATESKPGAPADAAKDETADDDPNADPNKTADSKDQQSEKQSGRMVMIRVAFDPTRVEGKPVEPVAPERMVLPENFGQEQQPTEQRVEQSTGPQFDAPPVPRESDPSATSNSNDSTKPVGSGTLGVESTETGANNESAASSNADPIENNNATTAGGGLFSVQDPADQDEPALSNPSQDAGTLDGEKKPADEPQLSPRDEAQKQLDADFEMKKLQFEQQKKNYEQQLKTYEEKVAKMKEKSERLKQRFADWLYVVPNSDLESLRMKRADIVKEKSAIDESGKINSPLNLPPGFDPSMLQGLQGQ